MNNFSNSRDLLIKKKIYKISYLEKIHKKNCHINNLLIALLSRMEKFFPLDYVALE